MKNILILLTAVMFVTSAQAVCSDYDGDQNGCNSNQGCQYETTSLKCGSTSDEQIGQVTQAWCQICYTEVESYG